MITEDYVSFEIAKLLKEKGFDGLCRTAYETITNEHEVELCSPSSWGELNQVKRPTLQMAMKWLREVHKIYIETFHKSFENKWIGRVYNDIKVIFDTNELVSYEEACEAAIKYCLEKLI